MGTTGSTEKQKGRIETFWKLGEKLGQGSFVTVRKVTRLGDGLLAAVKIIRKRDLDAKELKTLDREANILSNVHHEYCVSLLDIFKTKHHLYLVMELCTGGELFDAVCEANFSEYSASLIINQITSALIYLHDKEIVHRDLKPENLLFETPARKKIKLMDFGLAKALDSNDEALQTRCGTLHYVAPEVLSKKPYTHKCDFWSLGVVLYVLLCGYLPFYHEKRSITVRLVRKGKFDFDDDEWADISAEAKDLICRLLEKNVEARISGNEILEHPFVQNADLASKKSFAPEYLEKFKRTNQNRQRENIELLTAISTTGIQLKRWLNNARTNLGLEAEE